MLLQKEISFRCKVRCVLCLCVLQGYKHDGDGYIKFDVGFAFVVVVSKRKRNFRKKDETKQ